MQSSESITQFLRRRKSSRDLEESTIDWDLLKQEWLEDISNLYKMIREWLAEAEEEDLVTFREDTAAIEEDHFGHYEVPVLNMDLGDQIVEIIPVYRFIFGAEGRVDMVCGVKREMLMRKGKSDWGISTRASGSFQIVGLDENSFSELLKDLTT